jgi:hypothetical protein
VSAGVIGDKWVVISVGCLYLESECLILARVEAELLTEIELLVHILHHEIKGVLLCDRVKFEGIEVIAVYEGFELNNILVRAMVLF